MPLYIDQLRLRLEGPINTPVLQKSFNEIVRRHEALRTTFPVVRGKPVQVIGDPWFVAMPVANFGMLPTSSREKEVRRQLDADSRHPFDLARGPLVRACLFRLSDTEHILQVTMHHMITDAWSWWGILLPELEELYEAFKMGRPPCLSPLPIQLADYACWQREWVGSGAAEPHLAYWRRQLHEPPQLLDPQLERPTAPIRGQGAKTKRIELSGSLSVALRRLSRQEKATTFMVLLAGFKALLYRYTGQADIVVGTRVALRNRVELEGVIGFLVNAVALRTTALSGNLSFRALLRDVRRTALSAYIYKDLPFEKLVEVLQPKRNANHLPLFNVLFSLQNTPKRMPKLRGLNISELNREPETLYDLDFVFYEEEDRLHGMLTYKPNLFADAAVSRFLGDYRTLLTEITLNPDAVISSVPLACDSEADPVPTGGEL